MDIPSILLGTMLFLVFMAPIIYVIISNSKKEKNRLKIFSKLCAERKVRIKDLEVIGNTIMGMDEEFKHLVSANRLNIEATFELIPLSKLKSCTLKAIRVKNKTLDTVELDFLGNGFTKEIVFYKEEDESIAADGEACLNGASRWEKTIKSRLNLI